MPGKVLNTLHILTCQSHEGAEVGTLSDSHLIYEDTKVWGEGCGVSQSHLTRDSFCGGLHVIRTLGNLFKCSEQPESHVDGFGCWIVSF